MRIGQTARAACTALAAAFILTAMAPAWAGAAPVTTLALSEPNYDGPGRTYVSALTEFTLTSVPAADIWYRWTNGTVTHNWTKYAAPFTAVVELPSTGGAPPLPIDLDGLWTLQFNSTDSLGQSEATKSRQFYIDNISPVSTITFSGTQWTGDSFYIESDTQIILTAADVGSGLDRIMYRINTGEYGEYAGPFTVPEEGMSDIYYYGVDLVGNSEYRKIATVRVDNDPPIISFHTGTPQYSASGNLYITSATSIEIGVNDYCVVQSTNYRIDAGPSAQYTGQFTVPAEGHHTIAVVSTDMLGHASPENTLEVWVDNTAPSATVAGAQGGVLRVDYGSGIVLEATDSGAANCKIYYSIDSGVTWNLYMGAMQATEDRVMQYYAEDAVGNRGAEMTVQIWVEQPGFWTTELVIVWVCVCAGILAVILWTYRKLKNAEAGEGGANKKKQTKVEKEDEKETGPKRKMKRNR